MVLYTLPQCPEFVFKAQGSNRDKATFRALQQLVNLINQGTVDAEKFKKFSSKNFIEITDKDFMANNEEELIKAVKLLSKLAISRQAVQNLREQALKAYKYIDILFGKDKISQEDFQRMQDGFKVLKEFSLANLRYKEALIDAKEARRTVDEALEIVNEDEDK